MTEEELDKQRRDNLKEVQRNLKQRGDTIQVLCKYCECTPKAVYDVFNGAVQGKSRVKDKLIELLTPEEINLVGWKKPALLEQLEVSVMESEEKSDRLQTRIVNLERKVKG